MKYSIIIPTHNRIHALKEALENIYSIEYESFEVIVVIDGSTDGTDKMLSEFPCSVITHKKSLKVCVSRNDGAKIAKGEVLIFLDDDMLVPKNIFEVMDNIFYKNNEYDALFGPFSPNQRFKNFASEFKNHYMHYAFYMLPERVYLLVGGSTAIRKSVFDKYGGFDENYFYPYGEDHDLGVRIGFEHKIYRCREYMPEHIKHYTWKKVLKCDFDRAVAFIRLILRKRFITKEKLYLSEAAARGYHSISILLTALICIFAVIGIIKPVSAGIASLIYISLLLVNIKFLSFLFKQKGLLYLIKSCLFIFIDLISIGLGFTFGFLSFLFGYRKY